MDGFLDKLVSLLTGAGGKILLAIIVLIVGRIIIKALIKGMTKLQSFSKMDATIQSFLGSLVRIVLYALLIIAIIEVLGIPMTSVLTVLASAGLAIGLALQGALSNCAGGLMILLFKPFKIGDYISASGAEGTVKEITVFYTVILTVDNKRITVPNGSLMNANVTNFSSEDLRRVDLVFRAARGSNVNMVQGIMLKTAEGVNGVLTDPAPTARLSGYSDNGMEFTLRAWCKSASYWNVYFDLIGAVDSAFGASGIGAPVTPLNVSVVNK